MLASSNRYQEPVEQQSIAGMKVAFVGNQDNNAYRLCKWLRETGVDAHLYLIRQERGPRSRPEFVDRRLADKYPDWISQYDDKGRISLLLPSKLAKSIEADYDIVITSGASGLLASRHFRRLPVVHLTLGSEVSDFPLRLFRFTASLPWRGAAWLMRRALRRVNRIITLGFWPEMKALSKLGLLNKTVAWGTPEDAKNNQTLVNRELLDRLNLRYSRHDRVFVWLSRLNFRNPAAPEYKAPEKFLEAFERIALTDKRNVKAIIGEHGDDLEAFKELVRAEHLEPYVDYVPHLPLWELLTYCSIENAVVVDVPNMAHGHIFGGLAREALSVGAVLIHAWDENLISLHYGEGCPVVKAIDAESCRDAMAGLLDMGDDEFRRLKKRSADWARGHLHYEKYVARLAELLRQTIYCESFRRRRRCK